MLLSASTRAQQLVCVDADSLWNVFMVHEKVKAEHLGLKIDTMNLRAIIREKTAQKRDMEAVVSNYRVIVVPAMEKKLKLYQEINSSMEKKAKNNLLLGGGGGTLIGIILTLLLL